MKDKSIDGPGTPLPWRLGADLTRICVDWRDEHGNLAKEACTRNGWAKCVAKVTDASFADSSEHWANARYIVWSANNAPALVEALQEAREALEPFAVGDPHSLGEHHLINAERAYKRIAAVLSTALGEMNDA